MDDIKLTHFKMRSECLNDMISFFYQVMERNQVGSKNCFYITQIEMNCDQNWMGGTECSFICSWSWEQIYHFLLELNIDYHVMRETLAPIELYNGARPGQEEGQEVCYMTEHHLDLYWRENLFEAKKYLKSIGIEGDLPDDKIVELALRCMRNNLFT